MLVQVVEVHSRKRVVGGVKIWGGIDHVLVTDVSSRVARIIGSTAVVIISKIQEIFNLFYIDLLVAAGIAALISDHRKSSIHRHQLHDEVAQRGADVVCVDGDVVVRRVRSHILVHNRKDLDTALDVVLHHCTSA